VSAVGRALALWYFDIGAKDAALSGIVRTDGPCQVNLSALDINGDSPSFRRFRAIGSGQSLLGLQCLNNLDLSA
jgi:hypothetical protein